MAENEQSNEESNKESTPVKPPLRTRSAYTYFVKAKYHEVAQECKMTNPREVLYELGAQWGEMSKETKEQYFQMQCIDRIRYQKGRLEWFQAYGGRPPPTMRKRKLEFDSPPFSRHCFIIFEQRVWKEMCDQYPDLNSRELVQKIAERWGNMSADEKRPYMELTKTDKVRYGKPLNPEPPKPQQPIMAAMATSTPAQGQQPHPA